MSRTYTVTGINLKSMPLGESDRLVTVLTRELGLIRVAAPGARKHQSKLAGRSALFVVNELMVAKGRSLDKITQAETQLSYPGLSQDLQKLTASQYLAEIVLYQALSDQPQVELFELLNEHLRRLEQLPSGNGGAVMALLSHAIFHILAQGGIAPQVYSCCLSQQGIVPDFNVPDWRVGFSIGAGGVVTLQAFSQLAPQTPARRPILATANRERHPPAAPKVAEGKAEYHTVSHPQAPIAIDRQLSALELQRLQQLPQATLPSGEEGDLGVWFAIEQLLRQYVQYHLGRSIRSAALMDSCFASTLPA